MPILQGAFTVQGAFPVKCFPLYITPIQDAFPCTPPPYKVLSLVHHPPTRCFPLYTTPLQDAFPCTPPPYKVLSPVHHTPCLLMHTNHAPETNTPHGIPLRVSVWQSPPQRKYPDSHPGRGQCTPTPPTQSPPAAQGAHACCGSAVQV